MGDALTSLSHWVSKVYRTNDHLHIQWLNPLSLLHFWIHGMYVSAIKFTCVDLKVSVHFWVFHHFQRAGLLWGLSVEGWRISVYDSIYSLEALDGHLNVSTIRQPLSWLYIRPWLWAYKARWTHLLFLARWFPLLCGSSWIVTCSSWVERCCLCSPMSWAR